MSASICPKIAVPCTTRGPLITHARLTLYPRTLFIDYGHYEPFGWVMDSCEVLPLIAYPELEALHNGVAWVLEEIHQMFDLSDDPELAAVG